MRKLKGISSQAIVSKQQPAREPFMYTVSAIASRRLRNLRKHGLSVSKQEIVKSLAILNKRFESPCPNPGGSSGALDQSLG